jgi:hypothetical protein
MAGTVAPATVVHRPKGVVRIEVALTCDASGVVSETVIGEAYGRLVGVFYDGGLDASATVTLKAKPGQASLVSAPVFVHTTGTEGTPVRLRPTDIATDNAGVNVTAADTAPQVNRDIVVAGKLTITVASGGTSETGKYAFLFDETPVPPTFDPAITV